MMAILAVFDRVGLVEISGRQVMDWADSLEPQRHREHGKKEEEKEH
jgi:hypothetical protein